MNDARAARLAAATEARDAAQAEIDLLTGSPAAAGVGVTGTPTGTPDYRHDPEAAAGARKRLGVRSHR